MPETFADFGAKERNNLYILDADSRPPLMISVDKNNGNITSIRYNNRELNSTTPSHINSGFRTATVEMSEPMRDTAMLKVIGEGGHITHFYIIRKRIPALFMATHATKAPSVGELRFLFRFDRAMFNLGNPFLPDPAQDDHEGTPIEAKDIYLKTNGQTASKYYSGVPFYRNTLFGTRGDHVGAYFYMTSYESSSGGPFFRDINTNTLPDREDLSLYMFSGHYQTEPFRANQLHGPYALLLTNGPPPQKAPDVSFFNGLDLPGWAPTRGNVTGEVSGTLPDVPYMVFLRNATAQYWAPVQSGKFSTRMMKPGTYAIELLRHQLVVDTSEVLVEPGSVSVRLTDPGIPAYSWRIGLPDGTPNGFHHSEKLGHMHPSDARLAPWLPVDFSVSAENSDQESRFPAYQWQGINSPSTIRFQMETVPANGVIIDVGITSSHAGGRPNISVNAWTPRPQPTRPAPSSRSVTIGTVRGNNVVFSFNVPAKILRKGENLLLIDAVTGSGKPGTFLSGGFSYDFIGLR